MPSPAPPSQDPVVLGPTEPPLRITFQVARTLSGERDRDIKQQNQAARGTEGKKGQRETEENAGATDGGARRAPLSRILALRLDVAAKLFASIQASVAASARSYPFPAPPQPSTASPPSPASSFSNATDDDLHSLTARASLACLRAIHALSSSASASASSASRRSNADLDYIGLKDRKTLNTLLSLVSNWGLEPALLSYDAALEGVHGQGQSSQRFKELTTESEAEVRRALADAAEDLASLFTPVCALLYSRAATFDSESLVASQVLRPDQALASQIVAAAVRLCWGPAHPAAKAAHNEARTLMPTLLKSLPPKTLLSLLTSLSTPRSSSSPATPAAPVPTFVRAFAHRFLSAQLLRTEGIIALISTVLGVGEGEGQPSSASSSTGSSLTPSAKLDRLATLLSTPPAGMERGTFLGEHTLPSLLSLVSADVDGGANATESASTYAKVASFTFALLHTGKEADTLQGLLAPVLWEPLLRTRDPNNAESSSAPDQGLVLTDEASLAKALHTLELLVLHAPPNRAWVQWLLRPVAAKLWLLLESVCQAQQSNKVAEVSRAKPIEERREQVAALCRRWLENIDMVEVQAFLADLRGVGGGKDLPSTYFGISSKGKPCLKWGRPPIQDLPPSGDIETLLSNLSASISLKPSSSSSSTPDAAQALKLVDNLSASTSSSSNSSTYPSPRLFATILAQANRSDIASFLLPLLLEQYLGAKAQSRGRAEGKGGDHGSILSDGAGEAEPMRYLQTIVLLLDVFGEKIAQMKQEGERVLRFVNLCLVGGRRTRSQEQGVSVEAQPTTATDEEIPFLCAGGGGRGGDPAPMAELLNLAGDGEATGETESNPAEPDIDLDSEAEEVDAELTQTAVDLLLSVLEGTPSLAPPASPLLALIASKLSSPHYTSHADAELRRVVNEARVVLVSRTQQAQAQEQDGKDDMPSLSTPDSRARAAVKDKYDEALKALQDPILPVRAEGLVLLREIAQTAGKGAEGGAAAAAEAAGKTHLPSIYDIALTAAQEEESYLYLNAIQTLKEVLLSGGEPFLRRALSAYVGFGVGVSSASPIDAASADKRLRVGESLLLTVQALCSAGAAHAHILLPPLLAALRDARLPTTLRASVLALLGTCVESFPLAVAARSDWVTDLSGACLDILRVEMVRRPGAETQSKPRAASLSDEDEDPARARASASFAPGASDATSLDASLPQLRRGALLLLHLLVRGSREQLSLWPEAEAKATGVSSGHAGGATAAPKLVRSLLTGEAHGGGEAEARSTPLVPMGERLRLPGGGFLPSLRSASSSSSPSTPAVPPLLFPLLASNSHTATPSPTLNAPLLRSARTLLAYVAHEDTDAVVRRSAGDLLSELGGASLPGEVGRGHRLRESEGDGDGDGGLLGDVLRIGLGVGLDAE